MDRKSTVGAPGKKTDAPSNPSKPKASATTSASASAAAPVPSKTSKLSGFILIALNKDKDKSKSSSSTAPKKLKSIPSPMDSYAAGFDLHPSDSNVDPVLVQIQKSSAVAELNIKKRERRSTRLPLPPSLPEKKPSKTIPEPSSCSLPSCSAALLCTCSFVMGDQGGIVVADRLLVMRLRACAPGVVP